LGLHDYLLNSNTAKEKHQICGYYLDEEQLAYWRSHHPNAPRPLFEAVVPVSTRCPNPPDDYTPLSGPVTIVGKNDNDNGTERGKMVIAIQELPELTRSRHLAPGIEELSLGTPMKGDCWQVQINGGIPIDQYLCIDVSIGVIYVGTSYTDPPEKIPLEQWRQTHTGFTYRGKPVFFSSGEQTTVPAASSSTGALANAHVRPDPQHPLRIGEDWYPEASIRLKEEGRCVVTITVAADGHIASESLQTSSGFPRLDEACLKAFHGQRMLPAIENGKPVETTVAIPIDWHRPQ